MNRWFYVPKPNPAAKVRLFCFAYAGGSAAVFRDWGKCLGADVEVLAIQLPGRGGRHAEPALRSLDTIVAHLSDAMAPLLDRPCLFFGHSVGALIAFELARALPMQNAFQLKHLIVSAKRAPQLRNLRPVSFNLPKQDFIAVLRDYEGTPSEILDDPELLDFLMPTIRADFSLSDLYQFRAEPVLECGMTLFGSLNDKFVPVDDLLAWSEVVRGGATHTIFDGGHFFIHSHADEVMARVERILAEVVREEVC